MFTLIDLLIFPMYFINSIEKAKQEPSAQDYADYMFIFFIAPFPFAPILSMAINSLWMTAQSYGLSRMLLIFNAMSIANLALWIILSASQIKKLIGVLFIMLINLIIKLLIAILGRKTI